MTTLRQIKNLAVPLIERHRDLVLVGPLIVVRPVHHLLRYICIDRTSGADRPRPRWSLTALLHKVDHIPLGLGDLLYRPYSGHGPRRLWAWSDPEMPQDFVKVSEHIALPALRAIVTLKDYCGLALPKDPSLWKFHWVVRLRCSLAIGSLDDVREILQETPEAVAWLDHNRPGLGTRLLALGQNASADDRAEIASMLHEREAFSVEKLKIGHIWEKTPFPIEMGAG